MARVSDGGNQITEQRLHVKFTLMRLPITNLSSECFQEPPTIADLAIRIERAFYILEHVLNMQTLWQ